MSDYLDRPLLDVRPDFNQVQVGQLDDFSFASQGIGKATPWKVTDKPRRVVRYSFALSREALGQFRQFVSDRLGRRGGFWLPIYLTDYALQSDAAAGDTGLVIKRVGLADAVSGLSQFKHLAVATWSTIQCYEIASVTAEGDTETITLTSGLTAPASARSTIIGGLIVARFGDDELTYEFAGLEFARVQAQFVELPAEYAEAHDGRAPVFLYRLRRGAELWHFTNWSTGMHAGDETWQAADITHGDIVSGIEFYDNGVPLTVATDDPGHPLRALADRNLLQQTKVEIFETDADTATVDLSKPVYSGAIQEVRFARAGVIKVSQSSEMRVAEMSGPAIQCQRTCNLDTYSPRCGLNAADYTTIGTVTAISVDPAWAEAAEFGAKATTEDDPNWFALGRVTIGGEHRFCVGQYGSRLYLNAPFRSAAVGNEVSALAGDDKRIGTCAVKFGNLDNFLGTPWMPNKNPQFEALETPKPKGGKKA